MLEFIIDETGADKISYIGFSQGTALGFGALALHPKLASKVNIMIALASTAFVRGLYHCSSGCVCFDNVVSSYFA